jgi:hypothetical protein
MDFRMFSLTALVVTCSCTLSSDFDLPSFEESAPEVYPNSSIRALINEYLQSGEEIYTFPETTDAIIEATVVSSDEAGNFYKSLVLQDKLSLKDESRGLAVMIDLRAYFAKYDMGRKVYVRAAGLSLQGDKGIYRLGFRHMGELKAIPESLIDQFIIRSDARDIVDAPVINAEYLNEEILNTRIRLRKVQFETADLGKSFAGEPYDSYNALRPLSMCDDEAPIFLSTSVYADFKSELLPEVVFDVQGILSREYDGRLVLILNSPEDLFPREESRCDREYLTCELSTTDNAVAIDPGENRQVVFYEDFEQIASTREIEEAGWTNLNSHFGSGKFVKRSSNDNTFLRISSYGTQEAVLDAWLISPPIELDGSMYRDLSFDTRATFNNGRLLTVWITTDHDLDPREAIWKELKARISEGTADGTNERFISSGQINLDCVEGTVRIAFRYLGGDPGPSTNYDIDNVLIRGTFP